MTRPEEAAFERCMDFLAQMIEKYGGEIDFPENPDTFGPSENIGSPSP